MNEKLTIRNFGPIREVELKLGKFNILIGEQATGKSTVAKLLAVCRYFSYIIGDRGEFGYPYENKFVEGLKAWGLSDSIKPDSYIEYKSKHYTLIARNIVIENADRDDDGNVFRYSETIFLPSLKDFSPEFEKLLNELDKIKPKSESAAMDFSSLFWTIPTSFFQHDVAAVMDNPFFFHTERGLQSIFSLGKNTIPNINDSLFNFFADLDQITRQFNQDTDVEPLDIVYKNENGKGLIRKKTEGEFFNLRNGASGYQSAIPIVLVTKYYNSIRKKLKTLIVEEPELNLFPSAQNNIVKYLANQCVKFNNTIVITTHSPYILTSLNNLLYSYKVGNEHKEDVKTIVEEKYWLNPEDVCAYMMLSNGTCESIIDSEGLIKAEKIDAVSSLLNADFNALMDIELNETK